MKEIKVSINTKPHRKLVLVAVFNFFTSVTFLKGKCLEEF